MEVSEPTLVISVGIPELLIFVRLIIGILMLNVLYVRFIHFCCCVNIFNKKAFLGRILLISLFGQVT